MKNKLNIFLNKKILIYGLGKSGFSAFNFLKNKSDVYIYDDFFLKKEDIKIKKYFIKYKNIQNEKFDKIIISPGIDINNCKLSKFLKKNLEKIHSDLDVFHSFFKNDCITITGTNGKSTTCKLLYDVFLDQKLDVKLVGNFGNPILSAKKIKKNTIFIIEASSYQLQYSKNFTSKYAAILNISPDHIERHRTINEYVDTKFKILRFQTNKHFAFVKKKDFLSQKYIKSNKIRSKIIKVDTKITSSYFKNVSNNKLLSETNKLNLSFVLEISKNFNLKSSLLLKTIKNFKGLKYRQQIIFKNKYLTIINDSKSTSFSASIGILKDHQNIYWLLGGIHKKGDKLDLSKKYFKNIKAFIYGKSKNFFNKKLKNKIKYENFKNLKDAVKRIFKLIKKEKFIYKTVLFSPSAASFDNFKNFEERGLFFNKLIDKHLDEI